MAQTLFIEHTLAAGPTLDYDWLNHAGVADQGQ